MSELNTSKLQEFDDDGAIFMAASRNHENCKVGLFGVPYDGTTSFRPGTRFGPSAIREISKGIETYCPELNRDLEDLTFKDFGSLDIPFGAPEPVIQIIKQATEKLINLNLKPLMLGGEHSISSGAVAALTKKYPDLMLVQLDAHADLREEWLGSKYSHACAMRRCLEVLPSGQLFQIGIRSGTREEFAELLSTKRLIPFEAGKTAKALEQALQPHLGNPMYLTIDLDWFDPSVLPGTGTPEPGGFFWQDFAEVVKVIRNHHLVGADIVELSPQLDTSGISTILAAKITRSLIMLLSK
ncbi:agmatinase [Prochlorococcus sp. MIT 1300]|uniref:agmatinase n=1 Tax=Prochlorococcus sp. MIT 1300 TaxID=3096218 RepID=UPI002A74EFEB|nr:agmatinase [Prochlorococcus sp. MIT 1300]